MHYWVVLRLSHCTRGIPLLFSAMYDHRVVTKYYVLSWVKSNSQQQQHCSLPETMLQCSHIVVHCWHCCLLVNFAPFIRYGDLDCFFFVSFLSFFLWNVMKLHSSDTQLWLNWAAKQQISWAVSLWRICITFAWPRSSLMLPAPSSQSEMSCDDL